MCKESQLESSVLGSRMLPHVGPVIKPGFFIGYINGQRIGHIGGTQFGNDPKDGFISVGYLLVDKLYRKQGYGTKLQDFILFNKRAIDWNIGADSAHQLVEYYSSMHGMQDKGINRKYIVSCTKVAEALQNTDHCTLVQIKPIHQIDFDKLLAYDSSVFGFRRREFLQRWITIPGSIGIVAVQGDHIMGYTVMQDSVVDNQALVGPMYSNDNIITRLLIDTLAKTAIEQQYAESLRLLVPVGANPGAGELIEKEIGFDTVWETKRIYKRGIPTQSCMAKIIATTSPG